VFFAALSLLPDLDVIGFRLGIPYGAPFGHRGATHSVAAAAAVTTVVVLPAILRGRPALGLGVRTFVAVASHGLLDALTDGGKGVALLWPWSLHRYFAPWRPIPVAPIGSAMLSMRGLHVAALEALMFLPLLVYALWPRQKTPR
jgi:inner membrane protein